MGRKGKRRPPKDEKPEQSHVGVAMESLDTDDPAFNDDIANFHLERGKMMLDPEEDGQNDSLGHEFDGNGVLDPADLESDEEEEDDEDEEDSDSDEGGDAEDLGDQAWGTRASAFYGTDYVDDGLGSGSEDEAAAAAEEEEALALQRKERALLTEEDFGLGDVDTVAPAQDDQEVDEPLTKAKMSDEQWMQYLEKSHPEVSILKKLVETKNKEVDEVEVLMKKARKLPPTHNNKELVKYLEIKFQLWLMVVQHALFYLHILYKRVPAAKHHPVVKTLIKDQRSMDQWESYGYELLPMIIALKNDTDMAEAEKELVRRVRAKVQTTVPAAPRGKAESKMSGKTSAKQKGQKKKTATMDAEKGIARRRDRSSAQSMGVEDDDEDDDDEDDDGIPLCPVEDMLPAGKEGEVVAGESKRAITYQMEKNKGLKPYRRKDYRNPRVKMRKKFRKANIKRKSQVRDWAPQTGSYGGEMTGISSRVVKSTQFKH